ncbi:MAG: peptidoglycan-associated lipoprotein Pal [Acidobacteria bacterium]|nr:peptidoglycan-associated lipoprotein Pal [Acidobacteriota bacterium]MSO83682.1 peptidoglycan-associated lipoprotein Pal [Acidobacteriota bacterium]
MPPPAVTNAANVPPPAPPPPPSPVAEPVPVPPMPVEDTIGSKSLDDLNRDSPLRPLFFDLDSSDVSTEGQQVLQANAAVLRKYPAWQVTIEGHCDERGTAEYNLALGERRALAARTYLVSLGIPADKVKTVSYGKEFPFDAGQDDGAWSKNRRAHFVITAK